MTSSNSYRASAIDLYAGVGGWALGVGMAGIEVVRSYEWWEEAANTHEANNGHAVTVGDIRELDLQDFPQDVDFVVGSPPCTQFSYANRGGNGDIADGLKDIRKFLEVIEHVRPRAWAMENVPRVAKVLDRELAEGGSLARFAHLVKVIEVVDASDWGVPQRRRRMIAGDFDWALLSSYKHRFTTPTLGDVVDGLAQGHVDPVYGWRTSGITDHILEEPLGPEELRMNREQKRYHRIYNRMPFPEPMDRTSRTVTALCTRVSRESLVVQDGDNYRRLSVREKASLQAFPVAFQFLSKTHSARVKMVGNAIPPLLTYFVGHALLGTKAQHVNLPDTPPRLAKPVHSAQPPTPRRSFAKNRRFAAAIPGLRFGSGMRIELENVFEADGVAWRTSFHYGPSKAASRVGLGTRFLERLQACDEAFQDWLVKTRYEAQESLEDFPQDPRCLQSLWLGSNMESGPYRLLDQLGETSLRAMSWLPELSPEQINVGVEALIGPRAFEASTDRSIHKLKANAPVLLAGAAVGSVLNSTSPLAVPA